MSCAVDCILLCLVFVLSLRVSGPWIKVLRNSNRGSGGLISPLMYLRFSFVHLKVFYLISKWNATSLDFTLTSLFKSNAARTAWSISIPALNTIIPLFLFPLSNKIRPAKCRANLSWRCWHVNKMSSSIPLSTKIDLYNEVRSVRNDTSLFSIMDSSTIEHISLNASTWTSLDSCHTVFSQAKLLLTISARDWYCVRQIAW